MRILMLGNSFTFYNDMPKILAGMLGAEVVAHTRGGAYLCAHGSYAGLPLRRCSHGCGLWHAWACKHMSTRGHVSVFLYSWVDVSTHTSYMLVCVHV